MKISMTLALLFVACTSPPSPVQVTLVDASETLPNATAVAATTETATSADPVLSACDRLGRNPSFFLMSPQDQAKTRWKMGCR
jgi:hypothetical protein